MIGGRRNNKNHRNNQIDLSTFNNMNYLTEEGYNTNISVPNTNITNINIQSQSDESPIHSKTGYILNKQLNKQIPNVPSGSMLNEYLKMHSSMANCTESKTQPATKKPTDALSEDSNEILSTKVTPKKSMFKQPADNHSDNSEH